MLLKEILTTNYLNYHIIIGSSNRTSSALTCNKEWNTKLISTRQGEIARDLLGEFNQLWESDYALKYDDFIPASNEPSDCEAIQTSFDTFGECREGLLPRSLAALQV